MQSLFHRGLHTTPMEAPFKRGCMQHMCKPFSEGFVCNSMQPSTASCMVTLQVPFQRCLHITQSKPLPKGIVCSPYASPLHSAGDCLKCLLNHLPLGVAHNPMQGPILSEAVACKPLFVQIRTFYEIPGKESF